MRFRRMFPTAATPIAVDFGASSVKLLQLSSGEAPAIIAAHEVQIPEEARTNIDRRFSFFTETLPGVLKSSGFKGRRVVCSPSSSHFTVQQVEVQSDGPISIDDQVRGEVAHRLGCAASAVVARSFQMPSSKGERSERVCLAIAREDVMRHVELFKRCRMDLVGVHPDHTAMLHGFQHLHRRTEDKDVVTMYVDAGWGSVKVVLGRGSDLVFARIVQVGGRHIDQTCAEAWNLSPIEARARRIKDETSNMHRPSSVPTDMGAEKSSAILRAGLAKARAEDADASVASIATMVDRRTKTGLDSLGQDVVEVPCLDGYSEIYETIGDELSLCSRYAAAAIRGSSIHRLVFLGGECKSRSLASHLAQAVGVKASVGDPLSRFLAATPEGAGDIDSSCEHPEWAVACGLCAAPMEL